MNWRRVRRGGANGQDGAPADVGADGQRAKGAGIGASGIRRRVERLRALERGFSQEVTLRRQEEGLLLDRERRAYLKALQDALAGAEAARVVLASALRRMEGSRRG